MVRVGDDVIVRWDKYREFIAARDTAGGYQLLHLPGSELFH